MSKKAKNKEKFQFGIPFQEEILHHVLVDKMGALILPHIEDDYFTLIEHQVIAKCLKKFHKSNKRVPSKPVTLELINELTHTKKYSELVTKEDLEGIYNLVDRLYTGTVLDSDVIIDKVEKFSTYINMKRLQESFDLSDFSQYEEYSKEVSKLLITDKHKYTKPDYLVADVSERQFKRQVDPQVNPTPFRQLNQLANGQGYPQGAIIVLLDELKATKTFNLVNIARSYMKMKKVVLYIDTENGKREIMTRFEQSTLNRTKSELLSGDFDKMEMKHLRKYKRLGAEFIVERIPANKGTALDISRIIDDIYLEKGLKVQILAIDFMGKMGSIGGHKDDLDRISNVYIDVANLAAEKGLEIVWTAQHVTRDAKARRETRYLDSDIAKCIDIARHANAIIGLNSSKEERDNGVQRWEMVVQRDGPSYGRCLFKIDLPKQRSSEFTVGQRKEYDESVAPELDRQIDGEGKGMSTKKSRNPVADEAKMKTVGDI